MENQTSQSTQSATTEMSYETKTIIVVVLFFTIYPAGLVFMWIWMKWPKWIKILLTIIPFLLMFLIFGFVLAILGLVFSNPNVQKEIQKNNNIQISQSQQANQVTPQQVSQNFYNEYLSCINKHFENNTGKTPEQDCQYESLSVLTSQLIQQLKTAKGYDPILCAQNSPNHIYVKESKITNNAATVIMSEDFKTENKITVELINDKSEGWKINNITCNNLSWKTYTNSQFGYSISYPSNWQLIKNYENIPEWTYFYPPTTNLKDPVSKIDSPSIGIEVDEDFTKIGGTIPTGNLEKDGIPLLTGWKKIQIAGTTATYYETHQCAPQCTINIDIPYKQNGNIRIRATERNVDKALFEKMYTSFMFTTNTSYSCPVQKAIDCMPVVEPTNKKYCEKDFIDWAKIHCPGFKVAF
jgi:hypothetical protein